MAWQPQGETLGQLAQFLKDSLSGHDRTAQKQAELMLKQAKTSPEINKYLAYLFSSQQMPSVVNLTPDNYILARSAAAIMLKNDIKTTYKTMSEDSKSYIKTVVFQALQDPKSQMRNHAGTVITEIVKQGSLMGWPQVLSELIALVGNDSGSVSSEAQQGAISALLKICDDHKRALDKDYGGTRPLNFLVPKLLEFTGSPLPHVRANSLACINVFIPEKPQAILTNLDNLLMRLFQLAVDTSDDVRKHVCRSFVHVAEINPAKIAPHMEGLVDYMVQQQRNPNDADLALDAAEFWLCVGEDQNLRGTLGPHLPKIVPVLLESMVYSEEDVFILEGQEEDAEVEDKESDIKPQFASAKSTRGAAGDKNGDSENTNGTTKVPSLGGDDDLSEGELEEYSDADDEDGADPEEQWNLRKCSAAALDVLAGYYKGQVFAVTLPYLEENLNHKDWPNREAAVLALGAIAEGCMDAVEPNLPKLTDFLLSLLEDKVAVVRQITCWTLGRYSHWASSLADAERERYFVQIMDGILKRMLDPSKRVQEAAASAFANLEEKANINLRNYAHVIVQQFVQCFARYKDRNMFILYDCVQTLAEHVGPELAKPEIVDMLMPALIHRWNKVSDQSREMFPLLECLSYVASALTTSFTPFAKPIFDRCIRIIHQNLEEYFIASNDPTFETPEKDFLVTSLDLLSAIIQALEQSESAALVSASNPNMFEMLAYCMRDINNDVRQSAYALLGDCAIYVFAQLQPHLPTILEILITQLDMTEVAPDVEETVYAVVNNACWSGGEIAMRHREGMAPYVDKLLQKFATILFNPRNPRSLNENAAIALGRLGIGCAPQLAPHLSTFAPAWLRSIRNVDWTDEKAHALKGFVNVVLINPAALENVLLDFFMEVADAPQAFLASPSEEAPYTVIQQALTQYKQLLGDNFENYCQNLGAPRAKHMKQLYGL